MSSTVQALNAECDALESMLQSGIDDACGGTGESSTRVDLCGRRVAYVGGRAGIVSHFRALVERLNGHFIHHDGGIEDHEGQLGRILGQADIVLCPVDCVSHRACLRAKRFCKRTAKPFVPLRSAGLSSFVNGLHRVTEFDRAPGRAGRLAATPVRFETVPCRPPPASSESAIGRADVKSPNRRARCIRRRGNGLRSPA